MSDEIFSDVTFASLGLEPSLLKGVTDAGFDRCTLIQAGTLPIALTGKDVAGQAQTGSGKSAAFLLATCHYLLTHETLPEHEPGNPRAIILAPTRELAVQIHKDGETLAKHTGLKLGVVYGGTGYDTQREMLRAGLDILIGTPGRLIDYFKQHVFNLKGVQVAVMDEADRMFDLGFIKDIRFVLKRMPPAEKRLNMLFSATLSHRVNELAWEHMNAPEVVNASPANVTVDTVQQRLYHVGSDEKVSLLLGLLKQFDAKRTILFTNTRRAAETVAAYLKGNGYEAGMLSGEVPQKQRLKLLDRFTSGDLPILVATDVAARGLHIPEVSHVINYDLPQDPEDYVHRVGRTARVGADGDAVSFACERYVFSLTEIENFIGKQIPVESITANLLERVRPPVFESRPRRNRHGKPIDEPEEAPAEEAADEELPLEPEDEQEFDEDADEVNGNIDPALLPARGKQKAQGQSGQGQAGQRQGGQGQGDKAGRKRRRRRGQGSGTGASDGNRGGGNADGNVAPAGDNAGNTAPAAAQGGDGGGGSSRRRRRRRRKSPAAESTG